MASSREYLDYILEQLSGLDGVTYRPMMGEFILYMNGKIIGGIYDDRLLVKQTASARKRMPEAPLETPYPGAKDMLLVEEVDDPEFLQQLFREMLPELPSTKPKRKKGAAHDEN